MKEDNVRLIPQSIEAEQSVIGGLLTSNDAIDRIGELKAEHFFRADHRTIFTIIVDLIRQGVGADPITTLEQLRVKKLAEAVGGLAFLNELAQNTPSAANIGRYAEIVVDRAQKRGLLAVASEIQDLVSTTRDTAAEMIARATAKLEQLGEHAERGGPVLIREYLGQVVERIDQEYQGTSSKRRAVSTGLRDLDIKLGGGYKPGHLIVVGGRPAMGKTAAVLGFADAGAHDDGAVVLFSMEMTGEELTTRALSRSSGLSLEKLMDGRKFEVGSGDRDWVQLTHGVQAMAETNIFIDETPALTLGQIQARAKAIKRKHGLALIAIDYLTLMGSSDGDNRTQAVGANTRGLKALAKTLNVPVVLLAQLSRKVEERPNKRPLVSDLRDSGEIEQDADVILFIYRDEVYNPDSPDKGVAEISISKQRNGPTGVVAAQYIGERTMFCDLVPGHVFGLNSNTNRSPHRGFN
jgi:replicative DNA helicase